MKPPDEHISGTRSVIPYYLAAAISFVIFHTLLIVSVPGIPTHYFQPQLLALTHLFVLGWATMMIFGASNQLIPVISESGLYSNVIPLISIVLLVTGVPLLIYSFWVFQFTWLTYTGSGLIVSAIILHSFNIFKTISAGKSSITTDILLMAHAWLLITGVIGLLLLINLVFPLFPEEHLHYLKIHAPIGMAGWFLQLIIGVSSKLVPMFILSRKEQPKLLHVTFYSLNAGLGLFLIEGMVFRTFYGKYFYLLLIICGLVSYALYIRSCYKSALRKQADAGMKQTFIAISFILVATALLGVITFGNDHLPQHVTTAFGFAFFCGLVSIIIMGQTFKTLPFIVWMHITKPNSIPEIMPKDLFKEPIVKAQVLLYLPGLLALLAGILVKNIAVLYVGALLMLSGAIIYSVHVFYITAKLKTRQV